MKKLTPEEISSVIYHDIFDYPLTAHDLKTWSVNPKSEILNSKQSINIKHLNSYYFINGREEIIQKRLQNEKASKRKLIIARKAAKVIARIPAIKLVAISGALAMNNASEDSDIDLLFVTSPNALWSVRPLVYGILYVYGFKVRKPSDPDEKNKLCLNLWMDESDLKISEKNIYTAHELAQLVPLVNKDNTYEKLMAENKWIKDYWPFAVTSNKFKVANNTRDSFLVICYMLLTSLFNLPAYFLQRLYMRGKMTRESVSLTRAFFHPRDWGAEIEKKLKVE